MESFSDILQVAERGDPVTQTQIGRRYENGDGVDRDIYEAVKWYRKAAERGSGPSQYSLAKCYVEGNVILQDFAKAYALFIMAQGRRSCAAMDAACALERKMTSSQLERSRQYFQDFEVAIINNKPFDIDGDLIHPVFSCSAQPHKAIHSEQMLSGYKIINLRQGTPEWLKWRNGGIGASDAPVIMGENPWKMSSELLDEKLGKGVPFTGNEATRRGSELEPFARKRYESDKCIEVSPLCLQSDQHSWMRASLDGLSSDMCTVVEIKCGESVYKQTASTGKVPQYYIGQLQHILAVTGLPSIDFFCYLPSRDPICVNVLRDAAYISKLISAEQTFWIKVLECRS